MAIDLHALAPRVLGAPAPNPTAALAETERALDLALPGALRDLLSAYGGALLFDNGARFRPDHPSGREGRDGCLSLVSLYGPGDDDNGLRAMNRNYERQVPPMMAVIGDAPGGDQVCLERSSGQIYLWLHDAEDDEASLSPVAPGFEEFVSRLHPEETSPAPSGLKIVEGESFLDF